MIDVENTALVLAGVVALMIWALHRANKVIMFQSTLISKMEENISLKNKQIELQSKMIEELKKL